MEFIPIGSGVHTSGATVTTLANDLITVQWQWGANTPDPEAFEVAIYTGNNPEDTSQYLIPLGRTLGSDRQYVYSVPIVVQLTGLSAAVRAIFGGSTPPSPWSVAQQPATSSPPGGTPLATDQGALGPDYLTPADQNAILQRWVSELAILGDVSTQGSLAQQADQYDVSTAAYQQAIQDVSDALTQAGAPANWPSVWPTTDTLGPWTSIQSILRVLWTNVDAQRTFLQAQIAAGRAIDTLHQAATTAMQKIDFTTDGVHIQGTTLAGGTITAQAMADSNSSNLIPNGNSEAPEPPGGWPAGAYEAAGLEASIYSRSGGHRRRLDLPADGSEVYLAIASFPVSPGEQYFWSGWIASTLPSEYGFISLDFLDASGTWLSAIASPYANPPSGQWVQVSANGVLPAGAVTAMINLHGGGATDAGDIVVFDDLYCGKEIVAGMLAANSVVAGNIQAGAVLAQNLTVANFDNLVPNPNTMMTNFPPGAIEAAGLTLGSGIGVITEHGACRAVPPGGYVTIATIPVNANDIFTFAANGAYSGGGNCHVYLQFLSKDGSQYQNISSNSVPGNGYITAVAATTPMAPIWAATMSVILALEGVPSGDTNQGYFNQFYLRRCSDASMIVDGTLQALFIRPTSYLASPNYSPTVQGQGASGYKLASAALGGAGGQVDIFGNPHTDILFDLGGALLLQGYYLGGLGIAKLWYGTNGNTEFNVPGTYTWTAPSMGSGSNPYNIRITMVGGGAGSAAGIGGGGAGGCIFDLTVTPGQQVGITVGAGGAGGSSQGNGGGYSVITFGGNTIAVAMGGAAGTAGAQAGGGISVTLPGWTTTKTIDGPGPAANGGGTLSGANPLIMQAGGSGNNAGGAGGPAGPVPGGLGNGGGGASMLGQGAWAGMDCPPTNWGGGGGIGQHSGAGGYVSIQIL